MNSWINEFSIMLINTSYDDALNDARIIVDELEKNLKKLSYLRGEHFIQYSLKGFTPGRATEDTDSYRVQNIIDWEIEISIPTREMGKNDALKIADITKFRIERICIELKHLIFQTIDLKKLGYIKFDKCRMMLEDDEDRFSQVII